jgi:hypothetical protein
MPMRVNEARHQNATVTRDNGDMRVDGDRVYRYAFNDFTPNQHARGG